MGSLIGTACFLLLRLPGRQPAVKTPPEGVKFKPKIGVAISPVGALKSTNALFLISYKFPFNLECCNNLWDGNR